ncbi:hypothetical protein [uncultured Desulfobacter sp.]|uniref:hypothetical protein n=1 Tax=uncultured Desulfobacter sp. TaxID=240139 RepID=UPI002AA7068C|nr:hypothetical protein [uncultured Desulfobacter sp.]
MTFTQRFYEIACMFPVMNNKGVQKGDIPGIRKDRFCADDLAGFIYEGGGRAWSTGEKLVIEFLLNLYNPGAFDKFNIGFAMNVWDPTHMRACFKAMTRIYSGEQPMNRQRLRNSGIKHDRKRDHLRFVLGSA